MSEFEINKAKSETRASNAQLEQALDNFKDAVDSRAETVGMRRDKINHLMEDKKQAAQEFIEGSFESAEQFLDRQSDMLHKTLSNTRSEAQNFLKDIQVAIDAFADDVRNSVSKMLGGLEDRRVTTFTTLFFAGCLVGGFLGRRYMNRGSQTAEINPNTSEEMKKIA